MAMNIEIHNETIRISGISELMAGNASVFRDRVRASFTDSQKNVEIDLSGTTFVDSCGLGALIAVHKTASSRKGVVRLINPTPSMERILEMTRLHRVFQIVRTEELDRSEERERKRHSQGLAFT